MANTDERQPADDQITQSRNSWRTRFVGYVKSKLQQGKAKKEHETPTDRAARLTATATVWMAAFTFILAATSGFTIWILKNQLREMHEGGIDTHKLADAAVASNRPWIGIDGIPTVRQESARWYIGFSVKNYGPSPALHAVLSSGAENVTSTEELNRAVEKYCTIGEKLTTSEEDSSGPSEEHGYVLFPGKIAQLQTVTVPSNQQNTVNLIGCATYFDQFGKQPVHHTSFCYSAKTPLVADKPMFACFAGWSAD